jgi:hypothetical protein
MLFVIMLCQRKTTQLNSHPCYAAMAICRRLYMQLAPPQCGYGNTLATAKCWLRQNVGAKLRDFLVPRLLEAAHGKNAMMLEYGCNGAMLGRSAQ